MVLSHVLHAGHGVHESMLPQDRPEILEKPISKADNMRMLLDLNGAACEVVTGVSLGTCPPPAAFKAMSLKFILLQYILSSLRRVMR